VIVLSYVLVWGMIAGMVLTLSVQRFVDPWPGKHRAR
jgi:hypothetical protein